MPNGSTVDRSERIEAQIERFASGFGARIIAGKCHIPLMMQRYSPNYVGGDINGGVQVLVQLFTRPVMRPPNLNNV